jgi:hypothetical protein
MPSVGHPWAANAQSYSATAPLFNGRSAANIQQSEAIEGNGGVAAGGYAAQKQSDATKAPIFSYGRDTRSIESYEAEVTGSIAPKQQLESGNVVDPKDLGAYLY